MITVTEHCSKPYALIGFADGLPYGTFAASADASTSTVAMNHWSVSIMSGAGIDGYESLVSWIVDGALGKLEPHPELHGKLFPTREAAQRAQYESGVLAYFIRLDSPDYTRAMKIIGY